MVATGNAFPVARCAQHPSGIPFGGIFPGDITGSEDAPPYGGANPEASARCPRAPSKRMRSGGPPDSGGFRYMLPPGAPAGAACERGIRVLFRRGSLRNGYHIQGRQQARKLPNPDAGR
jgi:hypothetical protein